MENYLVGFFVGGCLGTVMSCLIYSAKHQKTVADCAQRLEEAYTNSKRLMEESKERLQSISKNNEQLPKEVLSYDVQFPLQTPKSKGKEK